ncbi:hypothetical protein BCR34DRAFT_101531 [Clohesyomyces aquaticus]|uniref:Zn(2)-C6 fungal-type domain-containing protein n=1 Tax=Clohesyomyces aquaticus TaxID=1231657 RepID=A0A1Y1YSQ6_9PLEO|nr:hypothetical protein BCR34DRAFT_101531 [Clohesyomyces aquaticus]
MVGVPKSTGCAICRKRKIKCDEGWPLCGNCRKNRKQCPGPPSKHTFRPSGPKLGSSFIPVVDIFEGGLYSDVGSPESCVTLDSSVTLDDGGICTYMMQLNEKRSDCGGVYQKFRMCSNGGADYHRKRSTRGGSRLGLISSLPQMTMLKQPSPSHQQKLSRALINAFTTGAPGQSMSSFGPFIGKVPERIGHSRVLEAAVECIVNAHSSMIRGRMATEIADPVLYGNAVSILAKSLDNQRERSSPDTLCATVLLSLVEAMAGPRSGNNYLAHAGGAGKLIEAIGPKHCQDSFAKDLLLFNRGGIIITSIYQRKPCFLTSPAWRGMVFDKTGLNHEGRLYTDVLKHMADFPALLKEFKDLEDQDEKVPPLMDFFVPEMQIPAIGDDLPDMYGNFGSSPEGFEFECDPRYYSQPYYTNPTCTYFNGPSISSNPRARLLHKLQTLKENLSRLGDSLSENLNNGSAGRQFSSIGIDTPIPHYFEFKDTRVAVAYNCFWSLLILTNKLIMKTMSPLDLDTSYHLKSECGDLAMQICKSWKDAWERKPIGAYHTNLSFVLAYEFTTPVVQTWVLKCLNSLLEQQGPGSFHWTAAAIKLMSGKLCGEGADLVINHPKATK